MSLQLDQEIAKTGTRFKVFPQPRFLHDKDGKPLFPEPETLLVSVPPELIESGPADDRMYVVDANGKTRYRDGERPPWTGPRFPDVEPGPDGHFDHLDKDSREFRAATMYATVRRVLDIWEDYFGHRIPWSFEDVLPRMELIPLVEWDNAQSGRGFLEFGFGRTPQGTIDHERPYCENFDVLAHELGHSIIFSQVGVPSDPQDDAIDYSGFQESSGDLTAIVALLHFDTFVDKLLRETKGNLLTVNGLDRVGELSDSRQIRVALNALRMSDVGDEPHNRSLPLTGAIFDTMTEIFQKRLVEAGLISADLRERSTNTPTGSADLDQIAKEFTAAYTGHEADFKDALLRARDDLGGLLAGAWQRLSPEFLHYDAVRRALIATDNANGGTNVGIIRASFAWRGIDPPTDSRLVRTVSLDACGLQRSAVAGARTAEVG